MKKILLLGLIAMFPFTASANFTDVHWSHLHSKAVTNLYNSNIVRGYQDGTFRPEKNISRAEMLKILVEAKFLNKDSVELDNYSNANCFQDSNPQNWFNKYVCWAKNEGWVNGFENGTQFRPQKPVTLVEALKLALVSSEISYNQTDRWYKGVVDKSSALNLIPLDVEYFHNKITRAQMADLITRHMNFAQDSLSTYLGELNDQNVSFDTLKVRDNLYNNLNTDCKSPNHYRMISQTSFYFDQNRDCFNLVKFYTNSLDELPANTGLQKYKEVGYYTLFYKTTIEDQSKIDQVLNSITHYEDVPEGTYDSIVNKGNYESQNGIFFANFTGDLSGFKGVEFPLQYFDEERLPFEQQEQMWKLEAEDRFETLAECRSYNFPSFMMFKIKTFYEHCKNLGM